MAERKAGVRVFSRRVERRLAEVAACERRGESLKVYAERTGQSVYGLYEAKRLARQAGVLPPYRGGRAKPHRAAAAARFVEAVVARTSGNAPSSGSGIAWRLRLPSGSVLESATPLDAASLDLLLAGLGGAS